MLRLVGAGSKDQRVALPGMKFSFREGQLRKLKVGRETMQTEKENDSNIGQIWSKHIIGLSIFTIFLPIALPTPQRTTPAQHLQTRTAEARGKMGALRHLLSFPMRWNKWNTWREHQMWRPSKLSIQRCALRWILRWTAGSFCRRCLSSAQGASSGAY